MESDSDSATTAAASEAAADAMAAAADCPPDGAAAPPRKRKFAWLRKLFHKPPGADLSTGRVAAYGVGAFTQSMIADMPAVYLPPFLLEVVQMDPTSAGTLQLVAKVLRLPCLERAIPVALIHLLYGSPCAMHADL